jgi:hypothetical protein
MMTNNIKLFYLKNDKDKIIIRFCVGIQYSLLPQMSRLSGSKMDPVKEKLTMCMLIGITVMD